MRSSSSFARRRVVVTGIGCVTPLGIGVDDTWNAAIAGQERRAPDHALRRERVPVADRGRGARRARPVATCPPKEARRLDRTIALALVAAREALEGSKLSVDDVQPRADRRLGRVGDRRPRDDRAGRRRARAIRAAPRAAVRDSDDDLQHGERLHRDPPRPQGPEPLPRERVRDRRAFDRRSRARDRARRRRTRCWPAAPRRP